MEMTTDARAELRKRVLREIELLHRTRRRQRRLVYSFSADVR
jgi:hypothetical protein